jgi:nitric oxide reductase subunit B
MASFWLMSSGMVFMTVTLTFAGALQTHLQRVVGERPSWTCRTSCGCSTAMRFGVRCGRGSGALLFIYAICLPAPRGGDPRPVESHKAGRSEAAITSP